MLLHLPRMEGFGTEPRTEGFSDLDVQCTLGGILRTMLCHQPYGLATKGCVNLLGHETHPL